MNHKNYIQRDMPPEEFRKFGYQIIDWITEYLSGIEKVKVLPAVKPGDIIKSLPLQSPAIGEPFDQILGDIDKIIMPGMTHWNHPNFFAYFTSSASGPSILGELLSAAFSINGMLWKSCPSSTELEQVTLNWLRQMLGLPEEYWGIIYDTASSSSLHAIAAAREEIKNLRIREKGTAGRTDIPRLRIYTSEYAHSSIEKAAITLGIGLEGVHKIRTDSSFRMIPIELQKAIQDDRKNELLPFCVAATIGTTSTTSVDPIKVIAGICKEENLWLHVDAAHGGVLAMLDEKRMLCEGWEEADSIVVNPHKWLFVPIDLSAFYTKKPNVLKRAFSIVPEYLKTAEDDMVENYMDYGVSLGRRFRSLKLWFVLRYFGVEGLRNILREHIRIANDFAGWIQSDSSFELMAPVPMSTVCFRAHPQNINDEEKLNSLNELLLNAVNDTREIFLTHTKLDEKFTLRLVVANLRTEDRHVEKAWEIIKRELNKLK